MWVWGVTFLCPHKKVTKESGTGGSDASTAGGRGSEQSEWQRSIADEGFSKPRKISGTATGGRCVSRSRAPNTIISGMIAPGNHVDYDSLRGAPLPYVPLPSRTTGRMIRVKTPDVLRHRALVLGLGRGGWV